MHRRSSSGWLAAGSVLVALGCSDGAGGAATGSASGRPRSSAPAASHPAPSASAPASAAPSAAARAPSGSYGTGSIRGVASFQGQAPEMKVPEKRLKTEFCKDTPVKHNAVLVKDGKLRDVYVRLAPADVKGAYVVPGAVELDQKDCVYTPRVLGAVVGQKIRVTNSDAATHNVNPEPVFDNVTQSRGSKPLEREIVDAGLIQYRCDLHPWMRAFVFAEKHPFFAVTGDDGRFAIEKVPDGRYHVEAWHSQYGWKKADREVDIQGDTSVTVDFGYSAADPQPDENKGELDKLF
ncbi:MAG: hypothetical protein IT373_23030 [Polyangiaceae bacterium]|nr:hypothetical protein [Polyangiaceae bacterium]